MRARVMKPEGERLMKSVGEEIVAVGDATGQRQETCCGRRIADEARM